MSNRARELLERVAEILELLFEGPNDVDPNTLAMLGDTRLEGIRAYLAQSEQDEEPVAWTNRQEIKALNEECTVYMYAEPMEGEDNIPLYLHPAPRKPFVRLSEEEMKNCWGEPDKLNTQALINFARAIEDALEEKNK